MESTAHLSHRWSENPKSHGCVRLTNWDAQRLAGMLSKGVPVNFIEKQRNEPDFLFAAY